MNQKRTELLGTESVLPITFDYNGKPMIASGDPRFIRARLSDRSSLIGVAMLDTKTETMFLTLTGSTQVYVYGSADLQSFLLFASAKSPGQYYNSYIRGRSPSASYGADDVVTAPRLRAPLIAR